MAKSDLALIFDLDGTLIDSAPDIHAAVNRLMAHYDMPQFTYDQVRGFVGSGVGILLERCLRAQNRPHDGALHAEMMVEFIKMYETAHDLTTIYQGVVPALETLSSHPMALCTNKPEGPTRSVLAHLGLTRHFPVIVGGDTLPQRKPDPAPLFEAIRRIGRDRVLFVGDSEVDAETAARANVPFVLYTGGYRKAAPESLGAVAMFDHWAHFPEIVRQTA